MSGSTPSLSELYRLAEQLELDKDVPVQVARERDHALAAQCGAKDKLGRLRFWLDEVSTLRPGKHGETWFSEASAGALIRIAALFFGFCGMAAFLLTSGRGLVNVFMFMLLFVVIQLLLCIVAALVMVRAVAGQQALVLPVNPARLVVARLFPDRRYLREAGGVVRLLFLRYGQELGALFTLGAITAFFVVLALSDFTFVWGSTFALSDSLVELMTAFIAAPWASWLPAATVSGDLIFASRFHPAVSALSPANIEAMRGWWPFLIMSMVSYALLPRLVLWLLSKYFYGRQMRAAFTGLPGSERVLARMSTPLVQTQGEDDSPGWAHPGAGAVETDPDLLLLNWAGALTPKDAGRFEAFAAVAEVNIVNAGLGSLPQELERLAPKFAGPARHLYVAVKSWEPPMADLADFLAAFNSVPRCTLFLVPLAHKPISATRLGDWQVFARSLGFPVVDVQALEE
jgi:hypothetical protein